MEHVIGVDVGRTFTDLLLMGERETWEVFKVPTTPADPSIGSMDGLEEIARAKGRTTGEFISNEAPPQTDEL